MALLKFRLNVRFSTYTWKSLFGFIAYIIYTKFNEFSVAFYVRNDTIFTRLTQFEVSSEVKFYFIWLKIFLVCFTVVRQSMIAGNSIYMDNFPWLDFSNFTDIVVGQFSHILLIGLMRHLMKIWFNNERRVAIANKTMHSVI